jgi:hypothetical protein
VCLEFDSLFIRPSVSLNSFETGCQFATLSDLESTLRNLFVKILNDSSVSSKCWLSKNLVHLYILASNAVSSMTSV